MEVQEDGGGADAAAVPDVEQLHAEIARLSLANATREQELQEVNKLNAVLASQRLKAAVEGTAAADAATIEELRSELAVYKRGGDAALQVELTHARAELARLQELVDTRTAAHEQTARRLRELQDAHDAQAAELAEMVSLNKVVTSRKFKELVVVAEAETTQRSGSPTASPSHADPVVAGSPSASASGSPTEVKGARKYLDKATSLVKSLGGKKTSQ